MIKGMLWEIIDNCSYWTKKHLPSIWLGIFNHQMGRNYSALASDVLAEMFPASDSQKLDGEYFEHYELIKYWTRSEKQLLLDSNNEISPSDHRHGTDQTSTKSTKTID